MIHGDKSNETRCKNTLSMFEILDVDYIARNSVKHALVQAFGACVEPGLAFLAWFNPVCPDIVHIRYLHGQIHQLRVFL